MQQRFLDVVVLLQMGDDAGLNRFEYAARLCVVGFRPLPPRLGRPGRGIWTLSMTFVDIRQLLYEQKASCFSFGLAQDSMSVPTNRLHLLKEYGISGANHFQDGLSVDPRTVITALLCFLAERSDRGGFIPMPIVRVWGHL